MTARKTRPTAPKDPKRTRRAIATVAAAPQGWPALFERAASAANFDVDALSRLVALKREMDAHDDRRAFDQDFAAVQAEIGRVEANAYDPQKKRAYADLNALDDAVRRAISLKGFSLSFDSAPCGDAAITVTCKVSRDGCERSSSVVVRIDGVGLKGNANMSPAQASVATFSYGRRVALTARSSTLPLDPNHQQISSPSPGSVAPPLWPQARQATRKSASWRPSSTSEASGLMRFWMSEGRWSVRRSGSSCSPGKEIGSDLQR